MTRKETLSSTEHFKVIPAVYLILIKNDKILLLRRQNTGFEDGNYSLIAGHVKENENPTQTVLREAMEEGGIKVNQKTLRLVHTMYRRQSGRIDLFFTAADWEGEPTNMEPEKCDGLNWFPLGNLPRNIIPNARKVIEEHLVNKTVYSESE